MTPNSGKMVIQIEAEISAEFGIETFSDKGEDGLLTIDLEREIPGEKKPRKVEICGTGKLENKAA